MIGFEDHKHVQLTNNSPDAFFHILAKHVDMPLLLFQKNLQQFKGH